MAEGAKALVRAGTCEAPQPHESVTATRRSELAQVSARICDTH